MGELHAKFAWAGYSCCLWILRPSPVIHWHRGQALCLETRPRPPHRSLRHPPHGWGLVSCWRAPTLPHVRYKILPAQLLGGDNGTKLSLHIEKAPNRAISGEQGEFSTGSGAVRLVLGEFCTAHAAGRGVLGEFCTAHAVRGGVLGEFCTAHAVGRGVLGEFCTGSGPPLGPVAGLSRSWALGRGLPDPQVRSTTVAVGVLHYTKPSYGVSPACRTLL